MNELPAMVDLRSLMEALSVDDRYRPILGPLRKAARAQSCMSDLAQAESCCDALRDYLASPRRRGTVERTTIEHSLLATAVALYTRATSTNGAKGERGSVSVASDFEPDRLADHLAVISVRNRALAHVYPNEAVADQTWHDDAMFMVETEHGWQPAAVTRRLQFDTDTFERLGRLIPIVRAKITVTFRKRMKEMTALFNADPVSLELFAQHPFDALRYFGNRAAVENALAGMKKGWAIGLS